MTSKMIALRIPDAIIIVFLAILALSMAGLPLAGLCPGNKPPPIEVSKALT
jgi:hypothetical protein